MIEEGLLLVTQVGMFLFIVAGMAAMGLSLTVPRIAQPLRDLRMVGLLLLVNFGAERIEPFDSMLTREFVDAMWTNLQQFMAGETTPEEMSQTMQGEMELAAEQLLIEHPEWAEG